MDRMKVGVLVLAVLVLASAGLLYDNPPASAQAEIPEATASYFLKIDGIEGESTHKLHRGEIDITSFSWSESLPELGGGATPGTVAMDDFYFAAVVSKASPKLMESVANARHFPEAVFTARRASGDTRVIFDVKLEDVVVSSYHLSGVGSLPTENFSLNFGKITYTYYLVDRQGNPAGTVVGTWDQRTNMP